MSVSYEDAKRCPKCNTPGRLAATNPGAKYGTKVQTFDCENELCLWYNTSWIVQINPDGTIPEYKPGPKQFQPLTPGQEAMARAQLESIVGEDGK